MCPHILILLGIGVLGLEPVLCCFRCWPWQDAVVCFPWGTPFK
ncbi:hypothetical protein GLYMA_06G200950v4 [Glycine max]|nr:hypothetical protein GLYMA_06G200950v4 [Glycine max]